MPILINNESYDGLSNLNANAGKWIDCTIDLVLGIR